jgi:hypothetical protein
MAYTINRYSGTTLATVQDGTVDATSDLRFVGKNYAGYGEIQNENFLFLLESFSGASQPPKAITGQVWYDTAVQKLKFYNGTKFKNTGGAEVSATQPTGLTAGDFWWDSGNNQLYAFDGTSYILIGPQSTGSGVTQMTSKTVKDTTATNRSVIVATINDEVVYIISSLEFTMDVSDSSALNPEIIAVPAVAQTEESTGAADVAALGPNEALLMMAFDKDGWVEIKAGNGKMILSDLYASGSTIEQVVTAPIEILLGRSSGVAQMTFNGEVIDLKPHTRKDIARLTLSK